MNKNDFFAAAFSLAFVTGGARAQPEETGLGEALRLPIASMASDGQWGDLCEGSADFVVRAVDASAYAIGYTLEHSGGAGRVRVQIAGRGVHQASIGLGTVVTANALATGVVLAAAGESLAFVPNALGRAVLQDQRAAL
jgi:hypothetical protein